MKPLLGLDVVTVLSALAPASKTSPVHGVRYAAFRMLITVRERGGCGGGGVSYRDLELMLLDRGVEVDHTTIFRWIQDYVVELEKRIRPHLRVSNGSWQMDETYVKVEGRWIYLYRAVDNHAPTIDFLLS